MLVRELVKIDEDAEFRYDVQLSDFDSRKVNNALLRSYLFSSKAPREQVSSTGLLDTLLSSYTNPKLDNRIVAIANYGHGKSHLALVLANYFSKAYKSTELKIILDKINKAVDNPAKSKRFTTFREERKEFLVIRLRGDEPRSLREQFVLNLEKSINEHSATKGTKLPFWYQQAENLLNNLEDGIIDEANRFLEEHYETDLIQLKGEVSKERSDRTYDICRELFKYLHGIAPDFGGEVSIREMMDWAVNQFCGEKNPIGGLFILFDEFSLYVQSHSQRNAAGELQDLLNGIESNKGMAVFLAFAQHDPIIIARNALKAGQALENLEHELTRIPRKVKLYSLMESVIDSYLVQPNTIWQEFRSDKSARGPLARASNTAMDVFNKRYEETFRWDTETFDEIVTKGCFPLHPLTTAMLCDLTLQSIATTGNPRTVLGFVFEQINSRFNQSVIEDGKINWILPVELVDYFESYLPDNSFNQFGHARRALGPDAPEEQGLLIKALLLQEASSLPVSRENQVEFLSEAIGTVPKIALKNLKEMAKIRAIRYDPRTGLNTFWPIAASPHRIEQIIQERIQGKEFTLEELLSLNKQYLESISMNVNWGHPTDWEAKEMILTREHFAIDRLRDLSLFFRLSKSNQIIEGVRGFVVWLLAMTDEDINWFRENASKILNEAFPEEAAPPIVLILPSLPMPELIQDYQEKIILDGFSDEDRREVGIELYDHERNEKLKLVALGLEKLRGEKINYTSIPRDSKSLVTPKSYQASLQALGKISLQQLLQEAYRLAYRYSPPEFFSQYRLSTANAGRNATKNVATVLINNSLSSNREGIFTNRVARDLCSKFLLNSWNIVTTDFRIKEPGNTRISTAWSILESELPAGSKESKASDAIIQLLNPPFGFDYNTVTLLFCAWLGFYTHNIQVSIQGIKSPISQLSSLLSNGGKKFVQDICSNEFQLCVARTKQSEIIQILQDLIEKVNKDNFSQEEAIKAIAELNSSKENTNLQEDLLEKSIIAAQNLETALEIAEIYDEDARKIQEDLGTSKNVHDLVSNRRRISNLPRPETVEITALSPSQLEEEWKRRLSDCVNDECSRLEDVQRITQVELHEEQLNSLKKELKKAKLSDLIKRVDQALNHVASRSEELNLHESEKSIQIRIEMTSIDSPLIVLQEEKENISDLRVNSRKTIELKNQKLEALEQEIDQLELFANELLTSLDDIVTIDQIILWLSNLRKNYGRYVNSSYQEEFNTAEQRAINLRNLFDELRLISDQMPNTSEEIDSTKEKLSKFSSDSASWTSDQHKEQITILIQRLERHIVELKKSTDVWIINIQQDLKENVPIHKILKEFEGKPSYLEKKDISRIEKLDKRIKKVLDEDIVARIETEFRKINDPKTRKQCLKLLKSISGEYTN